MNIYIGNIETNVSEDDLKDAFEVFGQIESVHIIKDKHHGASRGFGFVEMQDADEGKAAIDGLNGTEMMGKNLNVSEAHRHKTL